MTRRRQRVTRMTEGEITAQLWAAKAQKAYEALILAQDAAGAITWTLDEQEEIEKLAKALRQDVGQPCQNLCQPMIERAKAAHNDDARTIEAWTREGHQNCDICARLRRRRAGRVIGFRLAGLVLDRLRYTLKVTTALGNDHLYRYGSKADAETAQAEISERAAKFGERYEFEIGQGEEV